MGGGQQSFDRLGHRPRSPCRRRRDRDDVPGRGILEKQHSAAGARKSASRASGHWAT